MNTRNRELCRQLFKNRIQNFVILTPDLVLILQTVTANLTTLPKGHGEGRVYV